MTIGGWEGEPGQSITIEEPAHKAPQIPWFHFCFDLCRRFPNELIMIMERIIEKL